jgi:hypothetical protein
MRGGKRLAPAPALADARARCLAGIERLPQRVRQISHAAAFSVRHSARLHSLLVEVRRRVNGLASRSKR